jgi:sugar phosphate isomerase/epimerase
MPYLRALRQAFEKQDIVIAEVIGWRNPIPQDDTMRRDAFNWLAEQLAVADELNARCCLSFAGTLDSVTSWTPHPGNLTAETFDLVVETFRKLIDAVRPSRTKLALEMMASCYPDSPDSYLALIRAVDREAFAVHLDPINLILSREQYFNPAAVIQECFAKLGPRIVSCHIKDIVWKPERGYHLYETIPGQGVFDLRAYLRELAKLPPDTPVMLEHLHSTEEYQQGLAHLQTLQNEMLPEER